MSVGINSKVAYDLVTKAKKGEFYFFPTCSFATPRLGNGNTFSCPFKKTQIIYLYYHKSWIWHRLKHSKTKLKMAL